MTVAPGDKIVMIPVRGGKSVAVKTSAIAPGDKVVLIPTATGTIAIKASPISVGDKFLMIPDTSGKLIALGLAGGGGGGEPPVPVPIDSVISFTAVLHPTDDEYIDLAWVPGANNDAITYDVSTVGYSVNPGEGELQKTWGRSVTNVTMVSLQRSAWHYFTVWGKRHGGFSAAALHAAVYVPAGWAWCWRAVYRYLNDTGVVVPSQTIFFMDVPYDVTNDPTGVNVIVYNWHDETIGYEVAHTVLIPGVVQITMPAVPIDAVDAWIVFAYERV